MEVTNPNGVVAGCVAERRNPVGVGGNSIVLTQGSPRGAGNPRLEEA